MPFVFHGLPLFYNLFFYLVCLMCICKVDKVTNTMSISVGARMSTVAKVWYMYMCVTYILDFFFQISIESFTEVSFFYILV